MGYHEAIEATGAVVVDFKMFGDYQGNWFAFLEDGRIVSGSYGSCSGCDAFQAEFSYGDDEEIIEQENGKYYRGNRYWDDDDELTKEQADEEMQRAKNKLADFGRSYVNSAETLEEITARYEIKCADDYSWDDDKTILDWLNSLKVS